MVLDLDPKRLILGSVQCTWLPSTFRALNSFACRFVTTCTTCKLASERNGPYILELLSHLSTTNQISNTLEDIKKLKPLLDRLPLVAKLTEQARNNTTIKIIYNRAEPKKCIHMVLLSTIDTDAFATKGDDGGFKLVKCGCDTPQKVSPEILKVVMKEIDQFPNNGVTIESIDSIKKRFKDMEDRLQGSGALIPLYMKSVYRFHV
ncbi:hypothetical protein DFA_10105 [Cavenderia fasciculata]|uniref:Uncharacterized protein n=1 Tax=Cavenderia fasciculata TaxID=261658 RepID=F4Q9A2_CACFS|nr:uncharacterized protein DFA_10105 [Cavenderia fasciculata]EGG15271.1 hypothetical protein DFA_10105 [Cavenderia fasciculata]|eukprot:XP_004351991.1 hypothetical protein DFA_10105 [Cavenderia fasciculata]